MNKTKTLVFSKSAQNLDAPRASTCTSRRLKTVTAQLHDILTEFASKTSMHGVSNAFNSISLRKRISWMLFTLAAFIGFSVHIFTLFTQYYQYQVSVKHVSQEIPFAFPDVTFCVASDTIGKYNITAWNMLDLFEGRLMLHSITNNIPYFNKSTSKILYFISKVRYASLNERQFHISLDDLMVDCRINGLACNRSSIITHSSSLYRGCYTFYSTNLRSGNSKNLQQGGEGLKVVFFIKTQRSLDLTGLSTATKSEEELLDAVEGVKVIIHPHSHYPVPEFKGVTLALGKAYTLGIKMLEKTFVSTTAKPCKVLHENAIGIRGPGDSIERFSYSQEMCFMQKYQDYFYQKCNCISFLYPLFEKYKQEDRCHFLAEKWIDYFGKTAIVSWTAEAHEVMEGLLKRSQCHDLVYADHLQSIETDIIECYNPCKNLIYSTTMSFASWPITAAKVPLYFRLNNMYLQAIANGRWTNLDDFSNASTLRAESNDIFATQMIKVDVQAENWRADKEFEELAYSKEKLLSDLGGNLGLWIGVSVLTVLECIDFFYHVIKLSVMYCSLLQKKRKLENNENGDAPDIVPKSIQVGIIRGRLPSEDAKLRTLQEVQNSIDLELRHF